MCVYLHCQYGGVQVTWLQILQRLGFPSCTSSSLFLTSSPSHLTHLRLSSVSVNGCEGRPVWLYIFFGHEAFVDRFVFQGIYCHFSTASVSHPCSAISHLISQANHSAIVADGSCKRGNSLTSAPSTSSVC